MYFFEDKGALMKEIIEMLDEGVLALDKLGNICYANKAYLSRYWGLEEEITQKTINELVLVDHAEQDLKEYLQRQVGKSFEMLGIKGKCTGKILNIRLIESLWESKHSYIWLLQKQQAVEKLELGESLLIDEHLNAQDGKVSDRENMRELTAIMTTEGAITKVNKGWEKYLGWKEKELIDSKLLYFINPQDRDGIEIKGEKIKKTEGISRLICKYGMEKWFEWQMQYIPQIQRVIYTAKDIDEEVKKSKAEKAYQQAKELEHIRDEFFANISHEFRTPINIILSSIQLLDSIQNDEHMIGPETFQKYAAKIKLNGYRLLRLSNNLIDLSRIDVGDFALEAECINLAEALESIVLAVMKCLDPEKTEVILEKETDTIITYCDIEKIEKVMLNLISNGVKYAAPDRKGKLIIRIYQEVDEVVIYFEDNGIGISSDKLPFVFDRFVQCNTSLNKPAEGTGMGLALIKAFIELHKGTVEVESFEGKGSLFRIKLPIVHTINEEAKPKSFRSRVEKCIIELSDIYF